MTPQMELTQLLMASSEFDTDDTLRGIGVFDGRCWVLLDSYDVDGVMTLNVVCAVVPGHDLDALIRKVWDLIYSADNFEPISYAAQYGGAPIGGRNLDPMDAALITVVSGGRL